MRIDLSYPEALQQIENEVEEIYQALGEEGVFELMTLEAYRGTVMVT